MFRAALAFALAAGSAGAPPPCDAAAACGADPTGASLSSDALTACAARCATVVFRANSTFLVSSVDVSHSRGLSLVFEAGARLVATTNASLYPIAPFFPPMGKTLCYRAVLFGRNVSGLTLSGPASAGLDGRGAVWQPRRAGDPVQAPKLLELVDAEDVTVAGLTLRDSANWHVHLVFARRVRMLDNTVLGNRSWGGTDGIDPHSSTDVLIDGALIDVGDDAVAVTSGAHDVTGELLPSARIVVRNSFLRARNFAIGSGTYANVTDVVVEDSTIGDDEGSAPWAIKIKSHCPDGGVVSNVTFQRLRLGAIAPNAYQQPNAGMAIAIYEDYGSSTCGKGARAAPTPARTRIQNITFRDIRGLSAVWAANPIQGIVGAGANSANVSGLRFENVSFGKVSAREPWVCAGVEGTVVAGAVEPPLPRACGV